MELNTRNQVSTLALPVDAVQPVAEEKKLDAFGWILSEGLLRDEGALYGIAGADNKDKLDAIASFYDAKRAMPLQVKAYYDGKIQRLQGIMSSDLEEISQLKKALNERRNNSSPSHHFFPVTFQFLAILSVCVCNFFLVRYWLSPVINSDIICVAIYLMGLFSVYIGRGIMDNLGSKTPDENEEEATADTKRIYFKEFIVAAVISLFICTLTFKAYPVEYSIVSFFVLFILFLTGKVFINSFFKWRKESTSYFRFMKTNHRMKRDIKRLNQQCEDAEKSLAEAAQELQEPEITLKKIAAEQEYKTHIFLSEYNLAVHSRQAHNISLAKQFA